MNYCSVTQQIAVPKLGSACVLAHSDTLGYVAGADLPKTVALYSVLPAPVKLTEVTPPAVGLDFASWATVAASPDAVALIYGASYNNSARLTRYLQVWRDGVLSPPLELVHNYVDQFYGGEKCHAVWTGAHWLVSTRVTQGGRAVVQFQRVSADGSEQVGPTLIWAQPDESYTDDTHSGVVKQRPVSLFGASIVVVGGLAYATGVTSNNVDRRTVRLATIDLTTFTITNDQRVDDGTWKWVDTAVVGLNGGGVEVLWYADGRLNQPQTGDAAIYSRIDFGPTTLRFPKGGDLSAGADSRVIVTKDAAAGLVAQVSSDPTVLTPWDGVTPEYRSSCASGVSDWMACATVGNQSRFWQVVLTDVPPDPVIPPQPIGPMSDPLPEGTWVQVSDFFGLDSACWPRGNKALGDGHGMDFQAVTHYGEPCLWEAKFDVNGQGKSGELLSIDADPNGYIHWRSDCSNPNLIDVPTDTRWLRKRMQIGRQYGLDCGDHQLKKVRRDGTVQSVSNFNREMWIVAVWPKYWCGADWGECEVMRYAYNNTGFRDGQGTGDPRTWVETYYQALKRNPDGTIAKVIGWGSWTADPSSVVFATTHAVFPDPPTIQNSFWHLGGQRFPPDLPPFEMPVSIPTPPQPPSGLRKPEVTVTAWTLDELKDGREMAFIDRENPGFGARVWVEQGSMFASFSNPVGFGRTGATRPVKPCGSPPIPPIPPVPGPAVVKFPALMASYYTAATDPDVNIPQLATFFAECGVKGTRAWLLDAWALGQRDGSGAFLKGQYDGFIPVLRRSDGKFDLSQWNAAYFTRMRSFVETMNQAGVFCHLTLLELYTWSERKAGLPFVPEADLGPYRNNVNGVRWGDPDDPTLFSLPDAWLTSFYAKVIQTLQGLVWLPEIGNEMPEKALHDRIRSALRTAGWTGQITVNRNEDTPGQYWNMGIDSGRYDRLALHGKLDLTYLDEEYPDEAPAGRPTTFREMWPLVDPKRIILSSDGGGGNPALQGSLRQVALDTFARGGSYEHQLALKRNRFYGDGTLRMSDLELDRAFLVSLAPHVPG